MTAFQYDPEKSQSNLEKHGIDFEQAQALWDDPNLVRILARSDDEIRIISVRRSRAAEVEIYES